MISFAVVGHEARIVEATDLAHSIGAVITVDDGTAGADANHLKAWQATSAMDEPWACVLEDDAQPVHGFIEQAEAALTAAPADVVSLYLGRGKPRSWQRVIPAALANADAHQAHWITANRVLHAVAVAMRTELRDDWLAWAPSSTLPIDQRLSEWCRLRGHTIAYTTPSLCDHADGPTLINHSDRKVRDMSRVAWRTGTRKTWNSKAVTM